MSPTPGSAMASSEEALVEHVVAIRRNVCPRTSYATSGSAASTVYALVAPERTAQFGAVSKQLKSSKEFVKVEMVRLASDLQKKAAGNVLIVYGQVSASTLTVIEAIFAAGNTKLVVLVLADGKPKALSAMVAGDVFSKSELLLDQLEVVCCYNYKRRQRVSTLGFNGQPSVQSRTQFRYLWSPQEQGHGQGQVQGQGESEHGRERLVQRLADRPVVKLAGGKYSTMEWDALISGVLGGGGEDYEVYDMVRREVLGSSIEQDLQKQIAISVGGGGGGENGDSKKEKEGEGEGGRANFLVDRTMESIPLRMRGDGARISCMLDYGCAEGAITAALGKALGLPAKSIIGADVRTIPAEGFTFMPLAAEEPGAETDAGAGAGTERAGPAPGTILPLLADASVDLVTTAMVLHHVTHARAVLLELRRVLSPRGALVLREHHCISTDMGAFLDITHGLYSLSWSQPVEWPDFLDEYKAFYRSREQWTQLLAEAGFDLADEKECGEGGVRNYNSAEARRRTNGSFPNVLKAYYAVYTPTPGFVLPKVARAAGAGGSVATGGVHVEASPAAKTGTKRASEEEQGQGQGREGRSLEVGAKRLRLEEREREGGTGQGQVEAQGQAGGEGPLLESKKYPGRFYRLNKTTGKADWV